MKQTALVFTILFLFTFLPSLALAHPGRTDSSGCHTCRTNCSNWGLSSGEYHCHNAKVAPQPEAPIRSHYGENGTGYTESWPEYEKPAPVQKKVEPPVVTPKPVQQEVAPTAVKKTSSTQIVASSSTSTLTKVRTQKKPVQSSTTQPVRRGFFQRIFEWIF